MSAYFILTQNLEDQERYLNEYVPIAMPALQRHGGELLVFDPAAERLEGSPNHCVVVLRFPDKESISAFLDDPEYQPGKELRYAITSNIQAVMVPEFRPPA